MCIRDSNGSGEMLLMNGAIMSVFAHPIMGIEPSKGPFKVCLLYTSDAADERSSVDLGGRRIIKKKKQLELKNTSRSQAQALHTIHEQ